MSCGLWKAQLGEDFRHGYVIGTQSLHEHGMHADFFNFTSTPYLVFITARAKDGGSMLRPEYTRDFLERIGFLRQLSVGNNTQFTFEKVTKFSALQMFEVIEVG